MRRLFICGAGNPEGVRLAIRVNQQEHRWDEICLLDDDVSKTGQEQLGVPVAGSFDLLASADPESSEVINLIARTTQRRRAARDRIARFGIPFASLVSPDVDLLGTETGSDLIAYQHASIGPEVRIGEGAVVFMGAIIGHESRIGDHCIVAGNAVLNARVRLGEGVYIGSNAVVLPEVEIGDDAVIGAGALVIDNVPAHATVVGGIADVLQFSASAGESATTSGTGPLLRTLWCEALGVDHVSPNWNFFDAGGTSLAALQLAQRIESATGISVGVIDLFRYPTLGEMEAHLRRGGRTVHDSAMMLAAQRRAELRRASMARFSSSFQLHP